MSRATENICSLRKVVHGMPECQNCGEFVTEQYVRVFTPEASEAHGPRVCPNCEDKLRDGADVREARSSRQ
jgi:hypothetical protein